MSETAAHSVHRLLAGAVDALGSVVAAGEDHEVVAVLTACEATARRLDRVVVDAVAALERRGVFAERGYRSTVAAVADLLGWERFEARRRVVAAEQVVARTGLDGAVLAPRLPATAAAFAAGRAGLGHVEVIARVLAGPAAQRLTPARWAGAEEQLAARAAAYVPTELHAWGAALVDALDQDGAEPDDAPPAPVNEVHLARRASGGGTVTARFDDAAMFAAVAAVLDATSTPRSDDDTRSTGERQAEALADVCGYVLDHGDLPRTGGHRPHVDVLIRLDDLQHRARGGRLGPGGPLSPQELRTLACDALALPIVLGGAGQPLDVGRATPTVPDALRRAVAARDGGCAHPGCDRAPSWCEVHHVVAWADGGPTRPDNLVMLCRAHHRRIHGTDWTVRVRDGLPEFVPPAWVDPDRVPRRAPLPALAHAG